MNAGGVRMRRSVIRYADMQEEIGRIEETIRTERAEWSEDGQEWSVCEINRNRSMLHYHTIGLFVISDGNLIEYYNRSWMYTVRCSISGF